MSAKNASDSSSVSLAILGGGNLCQALARGLVRSGTLQAGQIEHPLAGPQACEIFRSVHVGE